MLVAGSTTERISSCGFKGYCYLKMDRCKQVRSSFSWALSALGICGNIFLIASVIASTAEFNSITGQYTIQKMTLAPADIGRYKLKQPRCPSPAQEMRTTYPAAWRAPWSAKVSGGGSEHSQAVCFPGQMDFRERDCSSQAVRGKRNQNCCNRRREKSSHCFIGNQQFLHLPGASPREQPWQQLQRNNILFSGGLT